MRKTFECLELVRIGACSVAIPEQSRCHATVKAYLGGIFERLKVAGRAEAVAVGLRLGLLGPTSGPKAPDQASTKWVTP